MAVSLRELARHTSNPLPVPLTLRQMLKRQTGNLLLRVKKIPPFSIMTQNMALLVFPGRYLGTDRDGVVAEIIARIKSLSPDIVGLCEVFADGERETIRTSVQNMYPHFQEGPDPADIWSDGGLLLLSKHPILQHHVIVYNDRVGDDRFADKGVLHIRVHPPNSPMPYDIFFSHTQNIEESGGEAALYAELSQWNQMVQSVADVNIPRLMVGDLNIPGEVPKHYNQLITRLGNPVDFWIVAGNTPVSGFTYTTGNNFYADSNNKPTKNSRLDYILMKAGSRFIPILKSIEILKFTHKNRFISDHFGLRAQFEQAVLVDSFRRR
jgi:endonuclease/exonuclease/phosphatase family metal-dependent hydrolase